MRGKEKRRRKKGKGKQGKGRGARRYRKEGTEGKGGILTPRPKIVPAPDRHSSSKLLG